MVETENPTCDIFLSVGNTNSGPRLEAFFRNPVDAVFVDFDYTATSTAGSQSWSYVQKNGNVSEELSAFLQTCYDEHMPIEISTTATYEEKQVNAKTWWGKSLPAVSSEIDTVGKLNNVLRDSPMMESKSIILKPYFVEFLTKLQESNIPCVIFSAGLGDIVRKTLMKYDPKAFGVYIVSNFMLFCEQDTTGDVKHKYAHHCVHESSSFHGWSHPTITSANKNVRTLMDYVKTSYEYQKEDSKQHPAYMDEDLETDVALVEMLQSAKNILLVGDIASDAKMCDGVQPDANVLKVCFYTENHADTTICDQIPILTGESHYGVTPKNRSNSYDRDGRKHPEEVKQENDVTPTPSFVEECLIKNKKMKRQSADFLEKVNLFDIVLSNNTKATFKPLYAMVFSPARFSQPDESMLGDEDCYGRIFDRFFEHQSEKLDLVSVSGFARSGKDTFHRIANERAPFQQIAFAEKLRQCATVINPLIYIGYDHIAQKPIYKRYNDLIGEFGYELAKTNFPDLRRFLISLGHGARTYIHGDCWLNWAFEPHKPLFDKIYPGGVVWSANTVYRCVSNVYDLYMHLARDKHKDLHDNPTDHDDMFDKDLKENMINLTVDHFLNKDHRKIASKMEEGCDFFSCFYKACELRINQCETATTRETVNALPVIITDARYHNERAKAYGDSGFMVYVYIPGLKAVSPTEHRSLKNSYYHVVLENDGELKDYDSTLCSIITFTLAYRSLFPQYPMFRVKTSYFQ